MAEKLKVPEDAPVKESNETQDYRDAQIRARIDRAPTTKSTMGEGKPFGRAKEDEQAAQNRREILRLPIKKYAYGGGIESRGKTKGRYI